MSKLVFRNLLRNKRRMLLTLGSTTIALLLVCFLAVFFSAMMRAEGAGEDRAVVRNAIAITFMLPEAYWHELRKIDHVEHVAPLTYFGGLYWDGGRDRTFTQYATDPATTFPVFPEYLMAAAEQAAWSAERTAFISGKALADRYGWKIGDRIVLRGTFYPVDLELTLRGIFTCPETPVAERKIFFHRRYLEESLGNPGEVGGYWLKVDSPANVASVVREADRRFDNSSVRIKAETEKDFKLSFVSFLGNVRLLMGTISLAMLISVLFINANTIAMSTRERIGEIAVLKTLGFRGGRVARIVVLESLALFLAGAALSLLIAALLLPAVHEQMRSFITVLGMGSLRLTPGIALLTVAIAVVVGLLSSLPSAAMISRLSIADGLRKVV